MAKSSKQQLDELLGIMDELSKEQKAAPPPKLPSKAEQVGPATDIIPDDLPDSGTSQAVGQGVNIPSPNSSVQVSQPQVPQQSIIPQQPQPPRPIDPTMNLMAKDDAELMATEKNLAEIDELIVVSKNVMSHVYGVVTSTDILDAATIAAAAKLISETRALIAEHLTIQKDERDYLNKVQMENIKHRHQMELMEKKFELEQKRFQQKNPALSAPANNVQPIAPASNGMKAYSSADLMKMISEDQ